MKFEDMELIEDSCRNQRGCKNPNWKGGICKDIIFYRRKYYLEVEKPRKSKVTGEN